LGSTPAAAGKRLAFGLTLRVLQKAAEHGWIAPASASKPWFAGAAYPGSQAVVWRTKSKGYPQATPAAYWDVRR